MRLVLGVLASFVVAGCWPFGGPGGAFGPNDTVVCVQNELAAYGNVVARAGEARFDVMPTATICRRVNSAGPRLALTATTTGGGAAGPLTFADALPASGPGCWLWRLGPGRGAAILPIECTEAQRINAR